MGVQVSFDDQNLNGILEILEGFTLYGGADYSPVVLDNANTTGGDFINTVIGIKTLEMPFIIQHDVQNKYKKLSQILNVKEPKKLTFSNLPNVEFLAIPSGNLEFEETFLEGKGTITWVIPKGSGRSTVRQKQFFEMTEPGTLEATLINNGNDWATVDYHISHKHENGFIGIASEYGGIELGNPEEADTEPAEKSTVITRNPKGDFANWTNGTVNAENANKGVSTTMGYDNNMGGRLGVLPASFSDTSGKAYYGALKEFIYPSTAKHWYIWARAHFETGLMGQTGQWGLNVVDANGKNIASMLITKSDRTGNTATVWFRVLEKNYKTINFTPSYWIPPNPYGNQSREKNRNMFDLKKEGANITFFWYGQYYKFTVPEIENMEAKKLQFYVGQYKGISANTGRNQRIVTHMYLSDLTWYHNKVPYQKDVPNKYSEGTEIYIDGENEDPYVNNMIRLEDQNNVSTYFKIPPGETKVKIAYSSFSDPAPEAYAIVNEVFV